MITISHETPVEILKELILNETPLFKFTSDYEMEITTLRFFSFINQGGNRGLTLQLRFDNIESGTDNNYTVELVEDGYDSDWQRGSITVFDSREECIKNIPQEVIDRVKNVDSDSINIRKFRLNLWAGWCKEFPGLAI